MNDLLGDIVDVGETSLLDLEEGEGLPVLDTRLVPDGAIDLVAVRDGERVAIGVIVTRRKFGFIGGRVGLTDTSGPYVLICHDSSNVPSAVPHPSIIPNRPFRP